MNKIIDFKIKTTDTIKCLWCLEKETKGWLGMSYPHKNNCPMLAGLNLKDNE